MIRSKAPLGQNFLVDDSAARAIVDALGPIDQRLVIEIGPGGGALTRLLSAGAGRLIAIEFDPFYASKLTEEFAARENVRVLSADFLATDLASLVQPGDRALLVANLPYYITSDILLHLIAHQGVIESAVLMMQREVAERVTAAPGSRDYGMLSVTVQMAAETELLFTLPPEAFRPAPKVFSSVVRLRMRPRYAELGVERGEFERFLRSCFAQKRKTIASNLRGAGFERGQIAAALTQAGTGDKARAEELAPDALAALFRDLRG